MIGRAKSIGSGLVGFFVLGCLLFLIALLFHGAVWLSSFVYPLFAQASAYTALGALFILVPLSFVKPTRVFASILIVLFSYLWALTLWMDGLLTTLDIWGGVAVIVGLLFAGIGVVPIAMFAALLHGMWSTLLEFAAFIVLAGGGRVYGLWRLGIEEIRTEEGTSNADDTPGSDFAYSSPGGFSDPKIFVSEPVKKTYRYCPNCRVRVGRANALCSKCGSLL